MKELLKNTPRIVLATLVIMAGILVYSFISAIGNRTNTRELRKEIRDYKAQNKALAKQMDSLNFRYSVDSITMLI